MNKYQYQYQYHNKKQKDLKEKVELIRKNNIKKSNIKKQHEIPPLKKWIDDDEKLPNNKMKYNNKNNMNMYMNINKKNDNKQIKVHKKKKVINKKKKINKNNDNDISKTDDDDDEDIPINIVLKFTDSLELASKNLIKLTSKLKDTLHVSGLIGNNTSYATKRNNNNSINTSINNSNNTSLNTSLNTSNTELKVNLLYGQKFSEAEEEELDYLVKTRLKKRLIEIITNKNGNYFANTI